MFKGFSPVRKVAMLATTGGLILTMFTHGFAMGGGASDKEAPPDNTKRIKLTTVEEVSNTTVGVPYGWVRITPDQLALGANRVKPDTWFTVYFVNGAEKQAVGKEPTVRASGSGEVKFGMRLTEPLGARWPKIILMEHTDGKEVIDDKALKPYMEASLR